MDDGLERIDDAEELAIVRRQARRVHVRSALAGIALTGIGLAIGL